MASCTRTAGVGLGLGKEGAPASSVRPWQGDPFAEDPPGGCERFTVPVGDDSLDAVRWELHQEGTGAAVEGGEEPAIEAHAGQAHHRRPLYGRIGEQRLDQVPEQLLTVHRRRCPVHPAAGANNATTAPPGSATNTDVPAGPEVLSRTTVPPSAFACLVAESRSSTTT